MEKRYRDYAAYLKNHFHGRVQKLSVDGGFTCPNRDGAKGEGGCLFCNNASFTPDYCREAGGIRRQIEEGIRFFDHKYKGQHYLAYFQSYSNTYAPVEELRRRYTEALSHPQVTGIVVATRPDTVDARVLDYLEELSRETFVLVEYGVESMRDDILRRINRGHGVSEAEAAIRETARRGIRVGAHLIFGLPGEERASILEGALRLSEWPIQMLKLHQLQVIRETRLAAEYTADPSAFPLFSMEEYLELVVDVIERIRPDLCLERFVNQSPDPYLIAPRWGVKNFEFTAKLDKRLLQRDTWQGKLRGAICPTNPRNDDRREKSL